ncbi:MAG: prolyl oligopeptidase family serine peptidase [Verrucomicrobiales bacterium]|nr:prolyl oligopeptidase family serine peptidase [Verrucomicrobiales bacterium]
MRSLPLLALLSISPLTHAAEVPHILPPPPVADLSSDVQATLKTRLDQLEADFATVRDHARSADAHILLKAVRYALEFHEWYDKKPEDGLKKANLLLDEAATRIAALRKNETPWMQGAGWKVLGYYSQVDGSPQPYAVEVPEGLAWGENHEPVPMWIWLHGRGDTATDLHFIAGKLKSSKPGQFQPAGTIVVHPFGRYCNGYKSAGETDVLEARDDAAQRFHADENRIALCGFSMGGAGAWHLGAHFADQWACVHPGAGFVDVKRYQKLTPEQFPTAYEQTLWGVYDVPDYARNFLNVPLIVYSGEEDKQRDAAEYMSEILDGQGMKMTHFIGPGMGHKYHPEVIREVQSAIEKAVAKGRNPVPEKVTLQFRSERYGALFWVRVLQCEVPFADTRVDAVQSTETASGQRVLTVTTRNVIRFQVDSRALQSGKTTGLRGWKVRIDGQDVEPSPEDTFSRKDGRWRVSAEPTLQAGFPKAGGTCMEDPFRSRFVIVLPERDGSNPQVDAWVKTESAHFIQRWRSLMRGDPLITTVKELQEGGGPHPSDARQATLVLWGTPETNPLIADLFEPDSSPFMTSQQAFPASWDAQQITIAHRDFKADTHVLCASFPRATTHPDSGIKGLFPEWGRIVLNTGLTFREAHDRTNSLQNPKLPDWAVLDITQPSDGESAGKVEAADFFDAHWQVP